MPLFPLITLKMCCLPNAASGVSWVHLSHLWDVWNWGRGRLGGMGLANYDEFVKTDPQQSAVLKGRHWGGRG